MQCAELKTLEHYAMIYSLFSSFESWFDIDTIKSDGVVVANEREEKVLHMLHQVRTIFEHPKDHLGS